MTDKKDDKTKKDSSSRKARPFSIYCNKNSTPEPAETNSIDVLSLSSANIDSQSVGTPEITDLEKSSKEDKKKFTRTSRSFSFLTPTRYKNKADKSMDLVPFNKSDTSLIGSEDIEDKICNEMTTDFIDLQNALNGKDFANVFMEFLKTELSDENLEFYLEVQRFKELILPGDIQAESKRIYSLYIDADCEKQININSSALVSVTKLLNYPNSNMFDGCQEQILHLMKSDCYPRFLQSQSYKLNSKNLPSVSKRNKLIIPIVIKVDKTSQASSEHRSLCHSSTSLTGIDKKDEPVNLKRGSNKVVIMPNFEDYTAGEKNPPKADSIKILYGNRSYTMSAKDGVSFREFISFLNISNKELLSFYAFVLPSQKIIELSQNTVYYAGMTVAVRKFALIYFRFREQEYSVKCPYECTLQTIIDSLLTHCSINPSILDSIKLKNKQLSLSSPCSKYDRMTLTCNLLSD